MKRAFKLTAAALAAITAMSCTAFAAYADDLPREIPAEMEADMGNLNTVLAGGWEAQTGSVALSKDPAAKKAFKNAVKGAEGVSYKALAVLGKQIVAGTNYAILCRVDPLEPDAGATQIKVMYIYEDLQGNCSITNAQLLDLTEYIDYGGVDADED